MNDSIQRHVRGKRWIKILAGVGLVATVAIVLGTYWHGRTTRQPPLPKPPGLPKNVNQQLSGVTFTRSEKGRRIFVIHAARTLAYKQGGSTVLKDVYVEFFGESGNRHDFLRTPEGEYNPLTGDLSTPGEVELVLNASPSQMRTLAAQPGQRINQMPADTEKGSQAVYIKTSRVTSQDHGTQLESATPVHFHLGDVSGAARGLIYSSGDGEVILKHDVQAAFQSSKGPQQEKPLQLSASRLRYDGPAGEVQLWGPVRIHQGDRKVIAKQGSVSLNADNHVTEVLLEGRARALETTRGGQLKLQSDVLRGQLDPETSRLSKLVAAGHVQGESIQAGALANLKAHEVELNFDPATHVPSDGVAMGQVHLRIDQGDRSRNASSGAESLGGKISKEDLATEKLQFSFWPNGKDLRNADTSGPGTLVLYPESPEAGDRTVTAARFIMGFDSASHLQTLHGTGGTKIVFAPPPKSRHRTPAVSTASHMVATFDPATETVRTVEQSGNFRFHNGTLEAKAAQARDLAHEQKLILTGHPEVWDPSTRARADRIVILLASDRAEGIGGVHAIHTDPRNPASLPTNVIADRMVADRKTQVVHYEGHVRAWCGTDVVESASLDVYKDERRVSTNSPVVTSYLQPAPARAAGEKTRSSGPSPVTIRADRLDYLDAGRRARYSGNVELDTGDSRIEADRLDVYFASGKKQGDSELERAVAEGHVKIVQTMRYAKGEKAVYDATTGRVVMTGGPPTVYDTEKGSMTGQRLTFNIHDDRLLVDGSASAPAVSKHRVAQ